MEELTTFEIFLYAFIGVYGVACVTLTFKLIGLCDKFDEVLMILRKQAGVREHKGKLHPIDEDGNIKSA